jgi:hypothetical protein
MRFPQVAIGQRFAYQGKHYTKNGPLTASEEGRAEQRMIPRSAEVILIDTAGKPVKEIKQRYKRAEVELLVKRFKAGLVGRLREMAAGEEVLGVDQVIALIESQEVDGND